MMVDKVIVDLDVFSSFMKDVIGSNLNNIGVITVERNRWRIYAQVWEKPAKPK